MYHLLESAGSTTTSVTDDVVVWVQSSPPSVDLYRPGCAQPAPEPGPAKVPGFTTPAKTMLESDGSNTIRLVVQPVMSWSVVVLTQSEPPSSERQMPAP